MFSAFAIPVGWGELLKRTFRETIADDCLGLAAQLAYYFFLALFPAVLFVLAVASFFPIQNLSDDVGRVLAPFVSPDLLQVIQGQMSRLAEANSGGILTFGVLGAIWSSSAALVSIVSSLNKAYDIDEGRPWWRVRLIAIGLTIAIAVFVVSSLTLVVAGPTLTRYIASTLGLGSGSEWAWAIVRWPAAFVLVSTAIGLVYYFAPDADQDWVWVTPGAVAATALWLAGSLAFNAYVARFTNYNATYGAVGGVIVLLLWFYLTGLAILVGAEMNAEIEHASPHGKARGEKVPAGRKAIGALAARRFREHPALPARLALESSTASKVRHSMTEPPSAPSVGELFGTLTRDLTTLIQQQIALLRAELSEKAAHIAKRLALAVGGGVVACAGLLTVIAGLVLVGIERGLQPWVAAFLVGVAVLIIGGLLARQSLAALRSLNLVPTETVRSVKENASWLSRQTKE